MNKSGDIVLNVGKYVVGDPCYFIEDEDWIDFLEEHDFFTEISLGKTMDGRTACIMATEFGDGTLFDMEKNEYIVDSGLIGVIEYREGDDIPYGMRLVDFTEKAWCFNLDGFLHFGPIIIDTVGNFEGFLEEDGEEKPPHDYVSEILGRDPVED